MTEYKCIQCNYQSNNKSIYTRHLNSNKHKKRVSNTLDEISHKQLTGPLDMQQYEIEIERLKKEIGKRDKELEMKDKIIESSNRRMNELERIIAELESSHTYNITIENLVQICNPDDEDGGISNFIDLVDDSITYQKNQ